MSDAAWSLQGKYVEFCNCAMACPCAGSASPSHGHCTGVLAMQVDKGHYGDVDLDGITVAATFYFHGAMQDCAGHLQPILPENTSDAQRDAILKILSGEDQPVGSIFNIFSCVVEHNHAPVYKPIELDFDIANKTCRLEVPGIVHAETGHSHEVAGNGDATGSTATSTGEIKFDCPDCHFSLAFFKYDSDGMTYSDSPS